MPTSPPSSAEVAPQRAVAALARLILDYRLVTVLVSTVYVSFGAADPLLPVILVLVGLANLLPLLGWHRVAPVLLRHPAFLAADLVVTLAILTLTGTDGPLLFYTLGTAFLAGTLYSWPGALVFSGLLIAGYLALLPSRGVPGDFQVAVGTPSLYVLLALGAAAIRELLLRQARVEAELRTARAAAAAADERARLAREMHDTLGTTLHGIVLQAAALPTWVTRDPRRAADAARDIAAATECAAQQARALLRDLRAEHGDASLHGPLHESIERLVREWERNAGTPVRSALAPVAGLPSQRRAELLGVLGEALRNVERHADAQGVVVELAARDGEVVLTVADDGRGFAREPDARRLAAAGHYGVLGMTERAMQAGGRLTITPNEPRGTLVTVALPGERALADAAGEP